MLLSMIGDGGQEWEYVKVWGCFRHLANSKIVGFYVFVGYSVWLVGFYLGTGAASISPYYLSIFLGHSL